MIHTIHVTLEFQLAYLDVEIAYSFDPGEPMVWRNRDGTGYPGSDDAAELQSVRVLRWFAGPQHRRRTDHWVWDRLDELAHERVAEQWESRFEVECIESHHAEQERRS